MRQAMSPACGAGGDPHATGKAGGAPRRMRTASPPSPVARPTASRAP
jgi:hypothetical protein